MALSAPKQKPPRAAATYRGARRNSLKPTLRVLEARAALKKERQKQGPAK